LLQSGAAAAVPWRLWLAELFFPTRCAACGASGALLCADCTSSLQRPGPPCCALCGAPTAWPVRRCSECAGRRLAFDSARAAVCYTDPVPRAVHAWKERGLRRFAPLAAELLAGHVARPAADVITYVPPDGDRSISRGHQPARDLATALGERWQLPVERLVVRTRAVVRQTALSRSARRRNLRGAFAPARERLPERVIVVDDVYTTGATANAAASALRAGGVRQIHIVTFARTTRAVR
jgi:predicted amidophosphoribosyltransferase